MKATMISGRTLGQGASCESKMTPEFFKAASICYISEEDRGSIGLSSNQNVLIASAFGMAVLSAHFDSALPTGVIFIPTGPWANVLVGPDTGGCGTPQFKGVEVEVQPTDKPILQVRELFLELEGAMA